MLNSIFISKEKHPDLFLRIKKQFDKKLKINSRELAKSEFAQKEGVDLIVLDADVESKATIKQVAKFGLPVLALFTTKDDLFINLSKEPYLKNIYYFYYNDYSFKDVIGRFLTHVDYIKNKKGKFYVIDGADGAGKATQSEALTNHLIKQGKKVLYVDFPQYKKNPHAAFVANMMRGEQGDVLGVNPYLASLAYAGDRAYEAQFIKQALIKGYIVIANRYVSSSAAHQGSKIKNLAKRDEFINWLYNFEYSYNLCPQEDTLIYLNVPTAITKKLIAKKGSRSYVGGRKADVAELNHVHQADTQNLYLQLCTKNKNWTKIDCVKGSEIMPVADITEKIKKALGV